jgi:hypothetical protein
MTKTRDIVFQKLAKKRVLIVTTEYEFDVILIGFFENWIVVEDGNQSLRLINRDMVESIVEYTDKLAKIINREQKSDLDTNKHYI